MVTDLVNLKVAEITEHLRMALEAYRTEDFYNSSNLPSIIRHELNSIDKELGIKTWKVNLAHEIRDSIFATLDRLQNPKNCENAKKLYCRVPGDYGLGAGIQNLLWCAFSAYVERKMLVIMDYQWYYTPNGWGEFFKPLSQTCPYSVNSTSDKIFWDSYGNRTALAFLPSDLADKLRALTSNPLPWWYGQLLGYYLKLSRPLEYEIQRTIRELNYKKPIVGVHIRRGDKISNEGSLHALDEYMGQVHSYYESLDLNGENVRERRIYIATDDPTVLEECHKRFKNYTFLYLPDTRNRTQDMKARYSFNGVKSAWIDAFLLAKSDFLVGTFSSGFSRLAYSLMFYNSPENLENAHSLDVPYHNWYVNSPHRTAVYDHIGTRKEDLSFRKGDVILHHYRMYVDDAIEGKARDGYSSGILEKTGEKGRFPEYKTKIKFDVADVAES